MCTGLEIAALGMAVTGAVGAVGGQMSKNKEGAANQQSMYQQQLNAQRQYELQTAGQTDSRGNRTSYTPGVGWRTDPTPTTRAIESAGDREKLLQLIHDAPQRREQNDRSTQFFRGLEQPTHAAISRLNGPRTDPDAFASIVAQRTGNDVARSFDKTAADIGRVGARTGNSTSTGAAMSKLATERSRGVGDAVLDSIIKGKTAGENIRTSEDTRLRNDAVGLITGQTPVNPFVNVPGTESADPNKAATTAGRFDPGSSLYAASKSIPGSFPNPYGQVGDLGILGGSLYDWMRKRPPGDSKQSISTYGLDSGSPGAGSDAWTNTFYG